MREEDTPCTGIAPEHTLRKGGDRMGGKSRGLGFQPRCSEKESFLLGITGVSHLCLARSSRGEGTVPGYYAIKCSPLEVQLEVASPVILLYPTIWAEFVQAD